MSLITTAWGFGLVAGPAIGGILTDPKFIPEFMSGFPYLLPNLVTCFIGLVSMVLAYIVLPETHSRAQPPQASESDRISPDRREEQLEMEVIVEPADDVDELALIPKEGAKSSKKSKQMSSKKRTARNIRAVNDDTVTETDIDSLAPATQHTDLDSEDNYDGEDDGDRSAIMKTSASTSVLIPRPASTEDSDPSGNGRSVFWQLAFDPTVMVVILIYGLFSYATIGADELLPLWASTSFSDGGISWTQSQCR